MIGKCRHSQPASFRTHKSHFGPSEQPLESHFLAVGNPYLRPTWELDCHSHRSREPCPTLWSLTRTFRLCYRIDIPITSPPEPPQLHVLLCEPPPPQFRRRACQMVMG